MFRLDPNPTFVAPVLLSRPGSEAPVKVNFTFKHKTWRELNAWLGNAGDYASDVEFLDEVIAGWGPEFVEGPQDTPVPYSAEALARLLDRFTAASREIVRDYRKGLGDARAGN